MPASSALWQSVTAVEIGALAILLWEFLWGLKRGLSGELARLLGTALVLAAGWRFYESAGNWLAAHTSLAAHPDSAPAAAFLLIVCSLALLVYAVGLLLRLLASLKFNDRIDRGGGGLAGLGRGLLVTVLVVYAAGLWPQAAPQEWVVRRSPLGRAVFRWAPPVIERLKAVRVNETVIPPLPEPPVEP